MNWILAVGVVALAALILSVVVLIFLVHQRRLESLPDGDYIVTIVGTHETPRGVATVFRIEEPKGFEGHTVTIVKEEQSDKS